MIKLERTTLLPSRDAALERIARVQPSDYARTRNHLEGAVTGLSPYVTHGLVTLPEVLRGVLAREALPAQHKLVFELGWREFFRRRWRRVSGRRRRRGGRGRRLRCRGRRFPRT